MAKQPLFLLFLFLSSSISSAYTSPPPIEATTREAIFLTIEEARSARDFLFLFTTIETVRHFGAPNLLPCIEHLMATIAGIQVSLERMFVDVRSTSLPTDAVTVKEDVSRMMKMDSTCNAAMAAMNRDIGVILMSRLDGLARSTYGVLDLVDQMEGTTPPPRSPLYVPTPPPPRRVSVPTPPPPRQVSVPTPPPPRQVSVPTPPPPRQVSVPTPPPPRQVSVPTPPPPRQVFVPTPPPPRQVFVPTPPPPRQLSVPTPPPPRQVFVPTPPPPRQVFVPTPPPPHSTAGRIFLPSYPIKGDM